jgi:hypothetical protein
MIIRLTLIFSLIVQLAWSTLCCGVVVLRPDVVTGGYSPACLLFLACSMSGGCKPAQDSCCAGSNCAPANAAMCDQVCGDQDQPCRDNCPACAPVELKKPGPAPHVVDIAPVVAHPLIPSPETALIWQSRAETIAPPLFFKCNHTRQAWLEVWLI